MNTLNKETLVKILNKEKANKPFVLDIYEGVCFFSKGNDWETNPITSEFFRRASNEEITAFLDTILGDERFYSIYWTIGEKRKEIKNRKFDK